jgi:nucleoside-diphosphate-sugar epimerase
MASIPISDATNQQIYNIGGEHMNLSEVADKIAKKYDVDVHYIPWPSLASRLESGDTMFDDNKLKSLGLGHYTKKLVDSI